MPCLRQGDTCMPSPFLCWWTVGKGGGGVLTEGMPFKTVSRVRVATYT